MPLSNASSATLRPPSHGSGPGWFATPSLYDSFIRDSMPVYPGAIQSSALRQPVLLALAQRKSVLLGRWRQALRFAALRFGLRRSAGNIVDCSQPAVRFRFLRAKLCRLVKVTKRV